MGDAELLATARCKISDIATRFFNVEELPQSPNLCVDTAILWVTRSDRSPLVILGQRFLRSVLLLPSYKVCSIFLIGILLILKYNLCQYLPTTRR